MIHAAGSALLAVSGTAVGVWGGWRLGAGGRIARAVLMLAGALGLGGLYLVFFEGAGHFMAAGSFGLLAAFLGFCERTRCSRVLTLALYAVFSAMILSESLGSVAAAWILKGRPAVVRGGVVIQQADFSCGPASAATCLARLGIPATEAEIAEEAGTTLMGTPLERLVPVLSRRLEPLGWKVELRACSWETLPRNGTPALLGSTLPGEGHAAAFLGFDGETTLIGCPTLGLRRRNREDFEECSYDKGIFFEPARQ